MAAPVSPRISMLPPNTTTVYLCTPPAPPYHCTFYALTIDETLAHLLSTHSEVPSYVAAYGTLGLRSLPIKAVLHTAAPHDADTLFVCFCCRMYFPLESSLQRHIVAQGLAGPIVDLVGEEGLRTWIRGNCRRRFVVAPGQGAPAPVGDAVNMLMRRLVRPRALAPVEDIEASPVPGDVRAPSPVVHRISLSVSPPPISPVIPHIAASPTPPTGLQMRLFFTWPLTPCHPLITLPTPRTAVLLALIAEEYAAVVGVEGERRINWDARLAKGLVVRYDAKAGAQAGSRVVRSDADLEAVWAEAVWAEVFVGDRRAGR